MKKFQELEDILRQKIMNSPGGMKLPSVRNLMRRYSLSLHSVNMALTRLEDEGLIEIKHGSGIYVSENKNARLIEFHRPDFQIPHLIMLERSLQSAIAREGWKLSVCYHNPFFDDPDTFPNPKASAHIIVPQLIHLKNNFFPLLLKQTVPIIAIGREAGPLPINYITVSDHQNISVLTKHLKELGHSQVGVILNESEHNEIADYKQIFCEILSIFDMPSPILIECPRVSSISATEKAYLGLKEHLKTCVKNLSFTALVILNPEGILGILRALHEENIQVPQKLSLISYGIDAHTPYYIPSITEVGPPDELWGENVVHLLKKHFENPLAPATGIRLQPAIHVRESSRKR